MPDVPEISVIVPIYKVEPWVERCVTSVLAQSMRSIELLLIDDCGADRSMQLARQAVERSGVTDIAVRYLAHDRNRGLSAARNTGIEAARGRWVYFLDSDDCLPADALERLYATSAGCDFVMGDYDNIGGEDVHQPLLMAAGLHHQPQILDNLSLRWNVMACNKLVRRQFLRAHHLLFVEGLIHEDNMWSLQLAAAARTMGVVHAVTYSRYVRPGSITTTEDMAAALRTSGRCLQFMHDFVVREGLTHRYGAALALGSMLSHLGRGLRAQGSSARQAHKAVRAIDPRPLAERLGFAIRHPKTEAYLLSYLLPRGLKSRLLRLTGRFAGN